MTKWDGAARRPLIPNEFQQMAGRAGRRGMDAAGHVIVPYSPLVAFRETLAIATGDRSTRCESAFTMRYNTILNLWDRRTESDRAARPPLRLARCASSSSTTR